MVDAALDEVGLHIVDEQIIRDEYVCPYHGFPDTEDSSTTGTGQERE